MSRERVHETPLSDAGIMCTELTLKENRTAWQYKEGISKNYIIKLKEQIKGGSYEIKKYTTN